MNERYAHMLSLSLSLSSQAFLGVWVSLSYFSYSDTKLYLIGV